VPAQIAGFSKVVRKVVRKVVHKVVHKVVYKVVHKVLVEVRVALPSVPKQVLAQIKLEEPGVRLFPMAEHRDLRVHLKEEARLWESVFRMERVLEAQDPLVGSRPVLQMRMALLLNNRVLRRELEQQMWVE
jgi:hypothetical protein